MVALKYHPHDAGVEYHEASGLNWQALAASQRLLSGQGGLAQIGNRIAGRAS